MAVSLVFTTKRFSVGEGIKHSDLLLVMHKLIYLGRYYMRQDNSDLLLHQCTFVLQQRSARQRKVNH